MRRLLAALLAVCCLLSFCVTALAEPAQEDQNQTEDGQEDTTDGEETPVEPEKPEEPEEPEEEPEQTPAEILKGTTHIQTMQITSGLSGSGKVSVTQLMYVSFAAPTQTVRFGLPENASGAQVDGRKSKASTQDGVRYLTVESEDGFTGTQTFTVTYSLTGVVEQQEESQLLTLPLLAAQDYSIASLQFTVTMPQSFDGTPKFTSDYLSEQIQDALTVSSQSSVISGLVTGLLRDHESIHMTLTLPEAYFTGNHGAGAFDVVILVLVLLTCALALLYWWRTLRNPPLRVQARTLPPDGVNPGDLPYLLSGGHADFNMLVSHWATLGYLSFYVTPDGNVILLRRMGMGNERRKYERKLFDLLFGGSDRCDGASLRYKKVGEKAMAVIPRYWNKRLYHKHSGSPLLVKLLSCLACALAMVLAMDAMAPDTLHGLFLLVGFVAGFALCWLLHYACGAYYLFDWIKVGIGVGSGLLLLILGGSGGASLAMLPAVALAVFIGWQTVRGGLRSPYGDQVLGQTLGFRRFLHNASENHILQMLRRDPQYFYKILPYAQAMGQGRRFVSLFHDVQLEPCQWYEAAEGAPRSAAAFYAHYCESLEMLNVSIRK